MRGWGKRARLLAAVQKRLWRCADGESTAALETRAGEEAEQLAAYLRTDDDLAVHQALGMLHWFRARARPGESAAADLEAAVGLFTPCILAGVRFAVPSLLLPLVTDAAATVAARQLREPPPGFDGASADTIALWRRILSGTPDDHPARATRVATIGMLLLRRYDRTGDPDDLDEVIRLSRAAVGLRPSDEVVLHMLHRAVLTRFRRTGDEADLEEAVRAGRQAVLAVDPGSTTETLLMLSSLFKALWARLEHSQDPSHLDEAIDIGRRVIEAMPSHDPRYAPVLSRLSTALLDRFRRTGSLADLDGAAHTGREAVRVCPADHPDRGPVLTNLTFVLSHRFKRLDTPADIDEAVGRGEEAVRTLRAGHPGRPLALSNLAAALQLRCERVTDRSDLDRAVGHLRRAVEATPHEEHPDWPTFRSNLAAALVTRHEQTGDLADLEEAVPISRQAVSAMPSGHPDRASALTYLGAALLERFERTGVQSDLDEAVDTLGQAAGSTPHDDIDHVQTLSYLVAALLTRFERTGAKADLDEAIGIGDEAIRATPAGHRDLPGTLNNQGVALHHRYERTHDPDDLRASIAAQRRALEAAGPEHHRRAGILSNLSNALRLRFEETAGSGDPADLDEAVRTGRAAVSATVPAGHPDAAVRLNNLSLALRLRFEHAADPADLDEAVGTGLRAVGASPHDHPDRAMRLLNLGRALAARYGHSQDPDDLVQAVARHEAAAGTATAPPLVRIHAALAAARLLVRLDGGQARAAELLEAAVRRLPEMAPRRLERPDQQHALSQFRDLASDAAALALTHSAGPPRERAVRALQLLEAGRAVLMSQALDTRDDLTELRRRHPLLAARFTELRDRLDQRAAPSAELSAAGPGGAPDRADRTARDRHRLAHDLTATLEEIREDEEFATFGLPPAADELLAEAGAGPVVVFNVSRLRSDALLLTRAGITALPLPRLGYDTLLQRVDAFRQALRIVSTTRDAARHRMAQAVLRLTLEWLWDAAAEPVLTELGHDRQPPEGGEWPRVWWAPGGLLGLLPVHAAGHHTDPADAPGRRTVLDRVVSSYTPTVRALRHARRHEAGQDPALRALVVAMPTTRGTEGGLPLRHVPAEVERLRRHLSDVVVLTAPDPEHDADPAHHLLPTRTNVLAHLPHCAVVHFACHGSSHPDDPSKSMLLLHDHDTAPLTVAGLAPVRLEHARLAYLSACRTAAVDSARLADEAIHLTSAFQLAGFPHVIGTLWAISDRIAVDVADTFYACLRTDLGGPDPGRAAHALHHAVRAVRDGHGLPGGRDRTRTPSLWAAYLHSGA
ncbi:CHAT domain-containing protein [Streptomyces sp. NPDC093094]|uniref:CHAT domain-containing tetratricopeptide repeat protein n=1 Tax=Streptomyces sp. NPDC093094 TaxID=3366026 RepID=UPI0038094EE7